MDLAVSAAAVGPTTVETAAPTVEATTTGKSVGPATGKTAGSASISVEATDVAAPSITTMEAVATAVAITTVNRVKAAVVVIEAWSIPRTGTDEDSAYEPARPIVAIRSASVGRITVVAVSASGWSISIGRGIPRSADSNSH